MKKLIIGFGLLLVSTSVYAELCPELQEVNELVHLLNTEYSSLPLHLQQFETDPKKHFEKESAKGKSFGQINDELAAKNRDIQNWFLMKQNIQGRIEQTNKNIEAVFNPICGNTQNGTRKTFKNSCKLRQAFATFISEGECSVIKQRVVTPIVQDVEIEETKSSKTTSDNEELKQLKARISELETEGSVEQIDSKGFFSKLFDTIISWFK